MAERLTVTITVAWSDGEADVLREIERDAREFEDTDWIECGDCCGGVVYFASGEQRCDVCDGSGVVAA
jgi:hypothetical protein